MSGMARWHATDIPDQSGRTAIVTGGNSGLGYYTVLELARHGAKVVLASRNDVKAKEALARIIVEVPDADVDLRSLDLADLTSIRNFADGIQSSYPSIDLLVNNAGVMAVEQAKTADGFEMQIGTNHLGHFALTGLLLPLMLTVDGARVVTVSSNAHKPAKLNLDDLQHEKRYRKWLVYGETKLANLLFAYELQRRLTASGAPLISVAAHPGTAATNLVRVSAGDNPIKVAVMTTGARLISQSGARGTLPQLYAATAPQVQGGEYFGPNGIAEQFGYPKKVDSSAASKDVETAKLLWQRSQELTGVTYPGLEG
jgi:NAD(P)-dependent dehydrogenase (short-subunit alcohol dehydrogenase family)